MEYAGSLEELKEIWMRVYTGHVLKWQLTNPTQDVEVSVPTLAGNDRFVFAANPENLTNKTLDTTNTVLGLTGTQAGYLTVSESVPEFMAAWRGFFQPNAKASAWAALSASDIENLSGVTSSIQTQFGSNTSAHGSFQSRLTALEGSWSGRPASAHIIVDVAVKGDSVGAMFTTVTKTFAAAAELTLYATPDEGAMYVISNKAVGDLTVGSWTVAEDAYLWLRFTGGSWYACESGGQILPSQLIEIIDLPGGDPVEDMSPQNLVFVRRASPMPGTVKFADGVTKPNKIYFCSNYSDESSLYCTDNSESTTFEIPPLQWAVFSFDDLLDQWVKMESGLLTQGEGGPAGLNQGSMELTVNYEDISTYNWHFIEKKVADPLTFTLKAAPSEGMLVQVKNSATAGDVTVGGNGNNIGAVSSITVAPGTFAWLLFRGSAWYLLEVVATQQLADTLTLPVASNCEVYAGEPVQWVTSEDIEALMRDSEVTIGSITQTPTSYNTSLVRCVALTSTTFVILYVGNGTQYAEPAYIQIITKQGTTLKYGVPITLVASQSAGQIDLIRLNDTQFVAAYNYHRRVGTVTDLTVTFGTAVALTTEQHTKSKMYRLTDNKFVNVYAISTGIKVRAATVATNTITQGTVLNFTTTFANLLGCCQMDASRILVITGYAQQQFYKVVTNTSGTSLTQGAEFEDVYDNGVDALDMDGTSTDGLTGNIVLRTASTFVTDILRVSVTGAVVNSVTKTALGLPVGAEIWDVFWRGTAAYVAGANREVALLTKIDFTNNQMQQVPYEFESNLAAQPNYQRNCGIALATLPDLTFGLLTSEGQGLSSLSVQLISLGQQVAGAASLYRAYTSPLRQLIPLDVTYFYSEPRVWQRNASKVWAGLQVVELHTYFDGAAYNTALISYDPRNPRIQKQLASFGTAVAPSTYAHPNYLAAAGTFIFAYADGNVFALTREGVPLGFARDVGFNSNWEYDPTNILQYDIAAISAGSKAYLALNCWLLLNEIPPTWQESVQFLSAEGNKYSILGAATLEDFHYLAGYQDSFYLCKGTTIYQRTAAQVQAGTAPTSWYTSASLLANPHQVFMFKSATDLWWVSVAAGKIQLARPGALSNTLTITTDAYAVADPDRRSMRVIQITDNWMLAVYNWNHTAGIKSIKMRVIELSGSTLSLGTENIIAMHGLVLGGSNVFSAISAVMLGDRYSIQVSVADEGIAINDMLVQVIDKNTIRPALRMGTIGEYLGLVDTTDGTTATVKLGPIADGFTGLATGTEYFVSEPGGLTAVEKVRDTRVGRALSPTQIRQRGPLVD